MIKLNLKTRWVGFGLGCGVCLFGVLLGFFGLLLSTLEGIQNLEAIAFCIHE